MKKHLEESNNVNYVIIILYLFTVFVPSLGAFDFAATQWLYLGILNTGTFLYFIKKPDYLLYSLPKTVNFFFGALIGTLLVSFLSMTQSIIIDESVIYISRILTFIISIYNLYLVFKQKVEFNFFVLSFLISIVLFIETFEVVSYFTSKINELRTQELLLAIPHRYGNQNILASAIVLKLPFLLYLFQDLKGYKKWFSLIVILLTVTSLLLIGARTAVLIMSVILIFFSMAYFFIYKKGIKESARIILPLVLVTIMAYSYSISINRIFDDKLNSYSELFFTKKEKDLYNPKGKSNLVDGSGRGEIWLDAINNFYKSPIIGVGIGNWRHNSKKEIQKKQKAHNIKFSTHVHNDFLQVLAETGVIGFVFYVLIYIMSFILLIKYYRKHISNANKLFVLTLMLALFAYMIDAFFNFPHHRAPIQIVFALVLAIIISLTQQEVIKKEANTRFIKVLGPLLIVVLILNLFNHYRDYKASTVQLTLMSELKTKDAFTSKFKYSYDEVNNMLPDFPYVNQIGTTNDDIKAMYAINAKQYKKANRHLNTSIEKIENNMWPKTLKAMMFNFMKNEDSAFVYANEVFNRIPSVESNFNVLRSIYKKRNDTVALFKLYDNHFKARPENINGWLSMCNDIRNYYRDDSLALKKVSLALESYPYDKKLLNFKSELVKIISNKPKSDAFASKLDKNVIDEMTEYFKAANSYFDQKDYTNARIQFLKVLDLEPNNLPTNFKLGLLENLTKNYKDAIPYFTKVINDKYLNNGRPEYSRGVSYLKLKDNANAKKDFLISRNKKWPAALKLNDAFFK